VLVLDLELIDLDTDTLLTFGFLEKIDIFNLPISSELEENLFKIMGVKLD